MVILAAKIITTSGHPNLFWFYFEAFRAFGMSMESMVVSEGAFLCDLHGGASVIKTNLLNKKLFFLLNYIFLMFFRVRVCCGKIGGHRM